MIRRDRRFIRRGSLEFLLIEPIPTDIAIWYSSWYLRGANQREAQHVWVDATRSSHDGDDNTLRVTVCQVPVRVI